MYVKGMTLYTKECIDACEGSNLHTQECIDACKGEEPMYKKVA
jgi:hypothetical protein